MTESIHTCHAECPCHTGGEPMPDFIAISDVNVIGNTTTIGRALADEERRDEQIAAFHESNPLIAVLMETGWYLYHESALVDSYYLTHPLNDAMLLVHPTNDGIACTVEVL
jgi:hypothetical protein